MSEKQYDTPLSRVRKFGYWLHDTFVNQKYDGVLPYSFHLRCVEAQAIRFSHLLDEKVQPALGKDRPEAYNEVIIVLAACILHDSIEDGRQTWNDVRAALKKAGFGDYTAKLISDIVYALTDEKGKNRAERKSEKYYEELSKNKLAVFVKLCDIAANILFSKLTNSTMYERYKKEFPAFVKKVPYTSDYQELVSYIHAM